MFQTEAVEKIKTHISCSATFFHTVCDIIWKSMLHPDRPQMTVWHMRISCWVPKATNTHSDYVTLTAFPLQQWLHKRASTLRLYVRFLSWWF